MAIEIFKLMGSILVNNDEANKSISKTDEKAEGLGSKLLKGVGTAAKWGTAIAGAAAAGGAALMGMATKSAETTDRIDKLSAKIGISKQGFQEWDYIMGQNGMDVEKLQVGVKTLVTQMDAAAGGSKTATEAFNKLGLSWNDGNGKLKNQEQMMNESIMALANMENGTEKARLATELFGKAGVEMMPMLNNGAQGIEDLKNRAHELGLVLGDDAVNAGVVLGDTIDDVKDSFGMITTQIGVKVMPLIQSFCDWILSNMPVIQNVLGTFFDGIQWLVTNVVGAISFVFDNLNLSWDTVMKALNLIWDTVGKPLFDVIVQIVQFVSDNWDLIWDSIVLYFKTVWNIIKGTWDSIGKPLFDFILSIVDLLANFFKERMPMITSAFSKMASDINSFWINNLQPCFKAIGDFISNVLAPVFKWVFQNIIAPVVDSVFRTIGNLWNNTLKPIFVGITDFLTGVFTLNWSKIWSGISNILSGLWSGIKTILWAPIQWFLDLISPLWEKITAPFRRAADAIGNIWSSIKSVFKLPHFTFSGSMNPLKWIDEGLPKVGVEWYAKGGIMNTPTVFGMNGRNLMVGGEKEPEAIAPISVLQSYVRQAVEESNNALASILQSILMELKEGNYTLFNKVVKAIESTKIEWNERELARLVSTYA